MSSDESDLTPESIKLDALGIVNNLLPEKSKEKYLKAYDDFHKWKTAKGAKSVSESVLLVYFEYLSCTKKSSSLCVMVKQFPLDEEYKKTGVSPQDISKLREWLHTQPHLPGDHITDLDLILAYHCCDGSIQVSKQVLDLHFTLKTICTSLFEDRTVDASIERALNTILLMPLPTRTSEGFAVFYTHFLDYDPHNYDLCHILKAMIMVWEVWQFEEGTWPGFEIVLDLAGMTLGHMARFNLASLQQYAYFLQEAFLVNLKSIHILNAPVFMDRILAIGKPFVKNSLLQLVHMHTTGCEGEYWLPREGLPEEVGGGGPSMEECKNRVIAKMRAAGRFFEEEGKKRVVEAKRPGRPKTISDVFGSVDGSFKQLEID